MQKSFGYAYQGIKEALKSERNLKIHFLISFFVTSSAVYLKFNLTEFSILVITIFSVIILELINTSIEKLSDIIIPEQSEKIRIVKDIAAGAVLLSAIASVIIGILLFTPKVLLLL